jgi:hypothetical protein
MRFAAWQTLQILSMEVARSSIAWKLEERSDTLQRLSDPADVSSDMHTVEHAYDGSTALALHINKVDR